MISRAVLETLLKQEESIEEVLETLVFNKHTVLLKTLMHMKSLKRKIKQHLIRHNCLDQRISINKQYKHSEELYG